MKRIFIYSVLLTGLLSSCVDLNQYPEDALSGETFFNSDTDYKLYLNGLYPSITRSLPTNRWAFDAGTDNYIDETVPSAVMQHSNTGKASVTSSEWNTSYDNIREVNYVLNVKDKMSDSSVDHYIGEAYYIRAYHYFTLLKAFGGVPYIDKVLGMDSEELYTERASRDFIATKIIEDLNQAIELLDWKGQGNAESGRINKECALLMKTRGGLFEGTWEYSHGKKGTPFAVEGKDGSDFLKEVVKAGDKLMANQKNNLYIGSSGFEYYDLFNKQDYADIPSAFYYKHYDVSLGIVNVPSCSSMNGFVSGVTHEFVTDCLMNDGKPEEISSVTYDYRNQASLIAARDPRLNQIIYSPARGPIVDFFPKMLITEANGYNTPYAPITIIYQPVGGYRIFKGTVPSIIAKAVSDYDDLILRYEEALLNYAEAKSLLGSITQTDIDNTVNLLRDRVGMVRMNLADVNSWQVQYSAKEGYDESGSNIVNEIRRERRVELVLEGFRTEDLQRWAIWEDVINGYKPRGAYYQEMADYFDDEEALKQAGFTDGKIAQVKFKKGQNIDVLGEFINPYWKNPDMSVNGRGYYIDPNRDYLQSIPQTEIDHYKDIKGVVLTQNPGWF